MKQVGGPGFGVCRLNPLRLAGRRKYLDFA